MAWWRRLSAARLHPWCLALPDLPSIPPQTRNSPTGNGTEQLRAKREITVALRRARPNGTRLRTAQKRVVFRSAKERSFRGAKGDNTTVIDARALSAESWTSASDVSHPTTELVFVEECSGPEFAGLDRISPPRGSSAWSGVPWSWPAEHRPRNKLRGGVPRGMGGRSGAEHRSTGTSPPWQKMVPDGPAGESAGRADFHGSIGSRLGLRAAGLRLGGLLNAGYLVVFVNKPHLLQSFFQPNFSANPAA